MRLRLPLTLLKIVVVSIPLTWLWIEWGREAYGRLFAKLALPIYGLVGLRELVPYGARDRFINYLPFLILMLITPRLSLTRRLLGTAVGFVVIFAVHVFFVYVASTAVDPRTSGMTSQGFMRIVPANMLSDAIPFALWAFIARDFVWEKISTVVGTASGTPGPDQE